MAILTIMIMLASLRRFLTEDVSKVLFLLEAQKKTYEDEKERALQSSNNY